MRCEEIRELLEEVTTWEIPPRLREHLATCPGCEAYVRDWRLVRGGFLALAAEEVPDASPGFAVRMVRRLERAAGPANAATEFFERVGRRVVLATSLLALTVLLALVLPSAGPLRGAAAADLYLAQAEVVSAESDPISSGDQEFRELAPVQLPGAEDEGKK